MSAESVTLRGQAFALATVLKDSCTITRITGQSTNTQTGVVTNTTATIYSGKCRVQRLPSGGLARPATVGEAQVWQDPLWVQTPVSVVGLQVGDLVTITASFNAGLVGRTFWVKGLPEKTFNTMHRFACEEVTG